LITLRKTENYQVRGFLIAEAMGRLLAKKTSSCYTVLKANIDVLISYLLSNEEALQVSQEANDAPNNRMSTIANQNNNHMTPSKRKR